jgi:hypothetical protein
VGLCDWEVVEVVDVEADGLWLWRPVDVASPLEDAETRPETVPPTVGVTAGLWLWRPVAVAAVELEGARDALGGTLSLTTPVAVAAAELERATDALGAVVSLAALDPVGLTALELEGGTDALG